MQITSLLWQLAITLPGSHTFLGLLIFAYGLTIGSIPNYGSGFAIAIDTLSGGCFRVHGGLHHDIHMRVQGELLAGHHYAPHTSPH